MKKSHLNNSKSLLGVTLFNCIILLNPGHAKISASLTAIAGGEKAVICHDGKTKIVSEKSVAKHLEKHGDALGACAGDPEPSIERVEICHKDKTRKMSQEGANKHLAGHPGDSLGPCPE